MALGFRTPSTGTDSWRARRPAQSVDLHNRISCHRRAARFHRVWLPDHGPHLGQQMLLRIQERGSNFLPASEPTPDSSRTPGPVAIGRVSSRPVAAEGLAIAAEHSPVRAVDGRVPPRRSRPIDDGAPTRLIPYAMPRQWNSPASCEPRCVPSPLVLRARTHVTVAEPEEGGRSTDRERDRSSHAVS
jgi:hypothetical protein